MNDRIDVASAGEDRAVYLPFGRRTLGAGPEGRLVPIDLGRQWDPGDIVRSQVVVRRCGWRNQQAVG